MQFLVLAEDLADASERRMESRQAHLDYVAVLRAKGHMKMGGAILTDEGKMKGSMLVVEFASLEALHKEWLDSDPYITNRVWGNVTIQPFAIAPSFVQV